jgi:hypothetical protein
LLNAQWGAAVPMTCVEEGEFTIKAAAFEIAGTGRFIASLLISRTGSTEGRLIDLPVTHGLFESAEEALESTVEHGRFIVANALPGAAPRRTQ